MRQLTPRLLSTSVSHPNESEYNTRQTIRASVWLHIWQPGCDCVSSRLRMMNCLVPPKARASFQFLCRKLQHAKSSYEGPKCRTRLDRLRARPLRDLQKHHEGQRLKSAASVARSDSFYHAASGQLEFLTRRNAASCKLISSFTRMWGNSTRKAVDLFMQHHGLFTTCFNIFFSSFRWAGKGIFQHCNIV